MEHFHDTRWISLTTTSSAVAVSALAVTAACFSWLFREQHLTVVLAIFVKLVTPLHPKKQHPVQVYCVKLSFSSVLNVLLYPQERGTTVFCYYDWFLARKAYVVVCLLISVLQYSCLVLLPRDAYVAQMHSAVYMQWFDVCLSVRHKPVFYRNGWFSAQRLSAACPMLFVR